VRLLTIAAGLLIVGGCKSDADAPICPAFVDTEDCQQECDSDSDCVVGLHCLEDEGRCAAECDVTLNTGCDRGERCGVGGRCEPDPFSTDASGVDGGTGVCADVELSARRTTPTVILVVDQSGSMNEDFGRDSRWNVLRDALLGGDGIIADLQSSVRFGLALFSSVSEESRGPAMGMCPMMTTVDPSLDNLDAITDVYQPADPIDETPTGDSIDFVVDWLTMVPDPSDDPILFVLATDGEPDTCAQANPQEGHEEAISSVERAFERGIQTFILSVGRDISEDHLQDVANAGIGNRDGDPDAPFWVAGDDDGLRDALMEIVGGALSCTVRLEGRINPDDACAGVVELNGTPLECGEDWEPRDESTIQILGDACDTLTESAGATLRASFPCDVILI